MPDDDAMPDDADDRDDFERDDFAFFECPVCDGIGHGYFGCSQVWGKR